MGQSLQRAPNPQALRVEPSCDDCVYFVRSLSKGPVRRFHLASGQVGEITIHAFRHLRLEYTIIRRLDEENGKRNDLLV